jgi:hypothetical protein
MTRSSSFGIFLLLGSIVIGAVMASAFIQFTSNAGVLFGDSTHTFLHVKPTANGLAKVSIRKTAAVNKSKKSQPSVGQLTNNLG